MSVTLSGSIKEASECLLEDVIDAIVNVSSSDYFATLVWQKASLSGLQVEHYTSNDDDV